MSISSSFLQDYHRFHAPVSGTIIKMIDVPGQLYTVTYTSVDKYFHALNFAKYVLHVLHLVHHRLDIC